MKCLIVLPFVLSILSVRGAEPVRSWTDLKGRTMKASLVKFSGEKIVVKREDGRTFTLSPDIFSEEDRKYLEEAKQNFDSTGQPWDRNRFRFLLVKQKWNADSISGNRFFDFEYEKIDIDGDGKPDGSKVWVRKSGGIFKENRPMAWEIDDNGKLIIKRMDTIFKKVGVSVLHYDKKLGFFNSKGIAAYPKFLKPHKRKIED